MKKQKSTPAISSVAGINHRGMRQRQVNNFQTTVEWPLRELSHRLSGLKPGWRRLGPGAVLASRMPWTVFIGEWLRSPRKIGAICPSGTALASIMAREVPAGDGLVVELGAGTGAVTEALLRNGIAAERLVAIEQSAALAACLRRRFPDIMVIEGDAAALSKILPDKPVDCIVSSIPLVSLPESARKAIIREMKKTLRGNRLIQYTYLWGGALLEKSGLQPLNSRLVLRNIPPARVMTFAAGTPDEGRSAGGKAFEE